MKEKRMAFSRIDVTADCLLVSDTGAWGELVHRVPDLVEFHLHLRHPSELRVEFAMTIADGTFDAFETFAQETHLARQAALILATHQFQCRATEAPGAVAQAALHATHVLSDSH